MSPVEIKFLLHCYTSPDMYRGEENASFMDKIVQHFEQQNIIEKNDQGGYALTRGGMAYVERLLEIPLPIQQSAWVFPDL